jgi:hypothetical protein
LVERLAALVQDASRRHFRRYSPETQFPALGLLARQRLRQFNDIRARLGMALAIVLLDAIRAAHPDAPAKDKGTEAALAWLAEKFPDVLRPPVCPQPLQPDLNSPARLRRSWGLNG